MGGGTIRGTISAALSVSPYRARKASMIAAALTGAVAGAEVRFGLFGNTARVPRAFAMSVPSAVTVRLPERAAVKVCYDLSGEAFTSGFALPRKVLYG